MPSVIESAIEVVGETASGAVSAVEGGLSTLGSALSDLVSGEEEPPSHKRRWLVLLLLALLVVVGMAWWRRSTATESPGESDLERRQSA
jgi:H+/Cl- antiporter ClcA